MPPRMVADPDRYPTEDAARTALVEVYAVRQPVGKYRGLWMMPTGGPSMHLFTDADPEWLLSVGWRRATR